MIFQKIFSKKSPIKIKMFVGNIIEYNTVFNLEIKTSNWIDL